MKALKGSFTIEAIIVVPLTMAIMVGIVFMAFLAYDKASMTAVCDYALMETAGNTGNNTGKVQNAVSELLNSRMLAVSDINVSAGGNERNAFVASSATFDIPLLLIRKLIGSDAAKLNCSMDISNLDGRGTLLLYKSILDGVSSLTDGMAQ